MTRLKLAKPLKILLWLLAGVAGLIAVLTLAAVLILPSHWFYEKVRERIVTEVERATGGRTELGSFRFDWTRLTAEVNSFVLHGAEAPGEHPLFRAERIQLGIKIISIFRKKVDLDLLIVGKPEINIIVDQNGHTNFPEPKVKRASGKDPLQQLLALAIKRFNITGGLVHFDDHTIPLDVNGENLEARLGYDFTGPRYRGTLSFRQLHLLTEKTEPMAFDFDSELRLEAGIVQFDHATLELPNSSVSLSGYLKDFKHPLVYFDLKARGAMSDVAKPLRLPLPPVGTVSYEGQATYSAAEHYRMRGKVAGQGIAVHQSGVNIEGIRFSGDLKMDQRDLDLTGIHASALDGGFTGRVQIRNLQAFQVEGRADGFTARSVAKAIGLKELPWSGRASGPTQVRGTFAKNSKDITASGQYSIEPSPGPNPISGNVSVEYSQRDNTLRFGESSIKTANTVLDVSGTLGDILQVNVTSTNLDDVLPAFSLASDDAPKEIPAKLEPGGTATFQGTVSGPMKAPNIAGNLVASRFIVQGQKFDKLSTALTADRSGINARTLALGQGELAVTGSARIGLTNWRVVDASPIAGSLQVRNAALDRLLRDAGQKVDISGTLQGAANISGTVKVPQISAQVTIDRAGVYGEALDRVTGSVMYGGARIEVINGEAAIGTARVQLSGAYEHPAETLKTGRLRFQLLTRGLTLIQIRNAQRLYPGLRGSVDLRASGSAAVRNLEIFPDDLNGQLSLKNLLVEGRAISNLALDAKTAGDQLTVGLSGDFHGSHVAGNASIQLAGDYPSHGEVQLARTSLAALAVLAENPQGARPQPFDGSVTAKGTFSGPLKNPEKLTAHLEIPLLEVVPNRNTQAPQLKDLALRNEQPIVVDVDGKGVHVRSARMVGKDTNLQVTGTLDYRERSPWDLHIDGSMNLAILRDFEPDLISSGISTVAATVRGTLKQPQLAGKLELKKASFYLVDLPNGIDNANGMILFDQNRATIQDQIKAETGGGKLSLAGFVGLASGEAVYRLQARAEDVRVRYPEGVSTSANAQLAFTGTSSHSVLSGTVSVRRIGFNTRTDVGGILSSASKPVSTPSSPSPFLRGMQIDVRIETAPNVQFQTSLTSDVQAEADLRVRGTAATPAVSGRVDVNQGEIQFFGNKYAINRASVAFYNQVKIEPVLDMDLQTTVRGVIVNITASGTLSKLNISYRSDPPLQSSEIVALLAVGRAPDAMSTLASSQTVSNSGFLATGTNTLLGQALASPVSSRLQRFFGVSRLKIDPLLTGINAVPQARLTVEQQISKDITLTYVTNLSQANQQIIRLEWDMNTTWSVVALREETGAFGIDLFYKKRFK
jgi:translocation and assembly module TamB